jgi:hypothetical protein
VVEWRLRLGKRSVERPQASWSDDLRRSWMRVVVKRDGEKLERPISSSGLKWPDNGDDESICNHTCNCN